MHQQRNEDDDEEMKEDVTTSKSFWDCWKRIGEN